MASSQEEYKKINLLFYMRSPYILHCEQVKSTYAYELYNLYNNIVKKSEPAMSMIPV